MNFLDRKVKSMKYRVGVGEGGGSSNSPVNERNKVGSSPNQGNIQQLCFLDSKVKGIEEPIAQSN